MGDILGSEGWFVQGAAEVTAREAQWLVPGARPGIRGMLAVDMGALIQNLAIASGMVALTVSAHFFGLLALLYFLRRRGARFRAHESLIGQGALVLVVVFGIFAIHTIEIWLYAVLYLLVGALDNFEASLYFSTVSFASLGYGDIVLTPRWRLIAAIEAANGVVLFAWSTAFLLSVMARLRSLEHDWLER